MIVSYFLIAKINQIIDISKQLHTILSKHAGKTTLKASRKCPKPWDIYYSVLFC